jgi:hypothetical protein
MRRPVIRFEPDAFSVLRKEASAASDGLETGGILLGCDDVSTLETHVNLLGGPGPNAQRRPDFFCRDLAHAVGLGDEAYSRDGSLWVGEWHTHPGSLVRPSRRDLSTYRVFLEDLALGFEHCASIIVTSADSWETVECTGWVISLPPGGGQGRLRVRSAVVEVGVPNVRFER